MRYFINIDSAYVVRKFSGEHAVQVRFAGNVLRTKSVSRNGVDELFRWHEQIRFCGMHPSMCQTFIVQLMMVEKCSAPKCIAECAINFADMLNNIRGPEGI